MSSLRNAVKRVTHKERAQPRARASLGILEKKKDYKVRAEDYHRKRDRLDAMQRKASMRNPDEFYFGMTNSQVQTASGRQQQLHRKTAAAEQKEFERRVGGPDAIRLMKEQDLRYVRMQAQVDRKKIEKLQASLHYLDDGDGGGDIIRNGDSTSRKRNATVKRKHTVFVEGRQEAEQFDVAKHFDTVPEFASRSYNRPRVDQIKRDALLLQDTATATTAATAEPLGGIGSSVGLSSRNQKKQAKKAARKLAKARASSYRELEARRKRVEDLERAEAHMVTEKLASAKGRKRKLEPVETGNQQSGAAPAQYKWRRKRLG